MAARNTSTQKGNTPDPRISILFPPHLSRSSLLPPFPYGADQNDRMSQLVKKMSDWELRIYKKGSAESCKSQSEHSSLSAAITPLAPASQNQTEARSIDLAANSAMPICEHDSNRTESFLYLTPDTSSVEEIVPAFHDP
jgi:hypothetical protein